MNEKKIKVTDKRLFTSEGELKEEYRHLEETSPESPVVEPSEPTESPTSQPPPAPEPVARVSTTGPAADQGLETPTGAETTEAPTFFDLVAAVAQPIALYLGDVKMPDGESMENLQLARLHIDLLEILQQKSAGNLTDEEGSFLQDLLYQLRLRYVEKTR